MKTTNKSISRSIRMGARTKKFAAKMANKTLRYKAKTEMRLAKAANKAARRKVAAQGGGLRGRLARKLDERITASQAKIKKTQQSPELEKFAFKENIKGENARKLSATRGKALVGVSSALAGGYGASKTTENMSSKAKAEAEKAASDLLSKQLESVPAVTTDDYSSGSVSGLVTGVR